MMPVEAVTVCVGYGDFLRAVAPHNIPHLARWVVVTTAADEETRAVCRSCSLDCVVSEDHTRGGDPFAKGRMIERGLAHLGGHDWVLHMDADIALPVDLATVLDDAHLDESCLYGCDRLCVTGWEAWQRIQGRGLWCRSGPWMISTSRPDCRLGARVANAGHGYTPIGFWQLWHGETAMWRGFPSKRYPRQHGTAARTDVQHALQWDRRQRVLIPELLVWHLESEPGAMGANWSGRTTARFGPEPARRRRPSPGARREDYSA